MSDKEKYLSLVNRAIYGWRMVPRNWIPAIIERAEEVISILPEEIRDEGSKKLEPLRSLASAS